MKGVVDVDEPATWPKALHEWVDEWAERKRGKTKRTCDLHIHEDQALISMLDGYLLRAFHCTRLLDHEREMIREQGLRALSLHLVLERIRRAHGVGALSDDERHAFETGHALTAEGWEERANTQNQVWLLLSRTVFDDDVSGLEPLLGTWGGEVIYFPMRLEDEYRDHLSSMGKPSIVVADLDLSSRPFDADHFISPSLGDCLVGGRLGLEEPGSEIQYMAPVPPSQIVSIWQPGDAEYDRHRRLPR